MNRKVVFPRPLQYLIAIVEHGSYTRAAEALHVSQPSLSQQIKQLEESLLSPLLVRSGRSVRLTDAGEIYIHHARRAYGELDAGTRAIQDVQNLTRGTLRLGWTPITDYLTCSLLEKFSSRYPGITLSTLEMPADDIEVAVAEDRIDIGIAFSRPKSMEPQLHDIEANMLFEESLCLAVGNANTRAGQKERVSAQELGKESLILLNTDFALRRHVDRYCHEYGVMPRIAIETDSLSVIIEMVQTGPLATILPKSIIRTQCGLYPIVLAPTMPNQAITIISRRGGYSSPASLAFTEMASEWAANRDKVVPVRKQKPCPLSDEYYRHKEKGLQAD
ncbi:MAG: transcriptional regulator CynR [Gammaproteobacteria bacterium]|nr:transcriptional regulator CynR [Gammaproteobacteria bacterium]